MFRILVADDEKVTRRGIVAMLTRGLKAEIECLEAANGKEALEIVEKNLIHLVVTDICMPLCSGLEFVEELRKTDPQMTVIIISGYENFEYAKQAVHLGVRDYIMKPVNKEEFLGLTENCLAELQKRQQEVQQAYIEKKKSDRIMGEIKRECILGVLYDRQCRESVERLKDFDIFLDAPFLKCGMVEYETDVDYDEVVDFAVKNIVDESLSENLRTEFISVTSKKGSLALIFSMKQMAEEKEIRRALLETVLLIERFVRLKAVAGLGEVVFAPEGLSQSLREASLACACKLYDNEKKVIVYGDLPDARPGFMETERQILKGLKMELEPRIQKYFEGLYKEPVSRRAIENLMSAYEELCSHFDEKLKGCGGADADRAVYRPFSELWSYFELRREIQNMLQYLSYLPEEKRGGENLQIINEIMDFTIQHVTEDIDLNYIAAMFQKTPGYIGSLFRKRNQMGFNEFVTRERIRLAKNMLKDKSLSVQQVGERCGYYNPKYFSVVFKKVTGVSPKTYQMNQEVGR